MAQPVLPKRPEDVVITATDGTLDISAQETKNPQSGASYRSVVDSRGCMISAVGEAVPVSPTADANFHSLGPLKLCGRFSRANMKVNIANSGSLPAGGAQFRILGKASPNAGWDVMFTWAQIQALTAGPSSGSASLVVSTDQSSLVFPVNSNVTFNMDVRALWAVDVQASLTSGAFAATMQLFAGLKADA